MAGWLAVGWLAGARSLRRAAANDPSSSSLLVVLRASKQSGRGEPVQQQTPGQAPAIRVALHKTPPTNNSPPARRQSKKLPDDQLKELQKSTNFDKKELQQWYRGVYTPKQHLAPSSSPPLLTTPLPYRLPQRLPLGHAHQERVPKDLRPVLPVRRPLHLCRLRLQRLRHGQVGHHRLQGVHLRPQRHQPRQDGGQARLGLPAVRH